MARSDVHPIHRFENWQVWPGSFDNPPVDGTFPLAVNAGLKITPATRIASMGSCFAREIKRRLLQRRYNYELTRNTGAILYRSIYILTLTSIDIYTYEDRRIHESGINFH